MVFILLGYRRRNVLTDQNNCVQSIEHSHYTLNRDYWFVEIITKKKPSAFLGIKIFLNLCFQNYFQICLSSFEKCWVSFFVIKLNKLVEIVSIYCCAHSPKQFHYEYLGPERLRWKLASLFSYALNSLESLCRFPLIISQRRDHCWIRTMYNVYYTINAVLLTPKYPLMLLKCPQQLCFFFLHIRDYGYSSFL